MTKPHVDMSQGDLITWAIEAEGRSSILAKEVQSLEGKMDVVQDLLSRQDANHEAIGRLLKEIRNDLANVLDLKHRVAALERRHDVRTLKTHAINWTPIIAAVASAILAAVAYYFPQGAN